MIVPEFMRFYSYKADEVLAEFAITFFSLVNAMYRLQAKETMGAIVATSVGFNGSDSAVSEIEKQAQGLHGIVKEVRTVKGSR